MKKNKTISSKVCWRKAIFFFLEWKLRCFHLFLISSSFSQTFVSRFSFASGLDEVWALLLFKLSRRTVLLVILWCWQFRLSLVLLFPRVVIHVPQQPCSSLLREKIIPIHWGRVVSREWTNWIYSCALKASSIAMAKEATSMCISSIALRNVQ